MTRKQKKHIRHKKEIEIQKDKKDSHLVVLILFILSVGFIYFCFDNKHIQDDAFITFQYVKNFLNGNGLVFNPGEHVEGYTTPLWLFILTFLVMFGAEVVQTAQFMSVLFGVASIISLYFLSKTIFRKLIDQDDDNNVKKIFMLIPSFMLTFNGAFQYWSISGMETSLFVLLIITALYFYLSKEKSKKLFVSSALFTFASFTRPEGWLIFSLVLLHYLFFQRRESSFRQIVVEKKNKIFLAIFLVPNIFLLAFRLIYYGYPLPNTFYAKTGFSTSYLITGLNYTWDFLSTYMLYGSLVLLIFVLIKQKSIRVEVGLLLAIIFFYTLYIIFIGGDALPIYRFFLPILPFILLLLSLFVYEYLHKKAIEKHFLINTVIPLLILVLVTVFNYFTPKSKLDRFAFYEDNLVVKMTSTANWLNEYQIKNNKKITVAATTIGALSYYSNSIIIDMLGLTDKKIAHYPNPISEISKTESGWKERNYDADYILSRKPDFIYFSTGIKPSAFAERALFAKEEFINYYYAYNFEPLQDFTEVIYKRKDAIPIDSEFVKFSSNPNFSLDYIDLYVKAINIKFDKEKFNEIFKTSEKIIKIGPINFSEPYRLIGATYGYMDREEDMINFIKKSLEVNFYNMNGHVVLLKYNILKKDTAQIKYHYDILKRLDPDYLIASNLAKVF